jgi:hypothetical protein
LRIAASAAAWEECGFAVEGDASGAGSVRLRFDGSGGGLAGWSLRDARSTELDGLPTAASAVPPPEPAEHPNGVTRIDHVVVLTPELERTTAAFELAGLALRRVREAGEAGPPVRQAFFRLAEVIVEVVESPQLEAGQSRFWGVTFAVRDLDRSAGLLGGRLGEAHAAVQPGQRIATFRRSARLGLPVALITERPRR